jgi:hypothetical protein
LKFNHVRDLALDHHVSAVEDPLASEYFHNLVEVGVLLIVPIYCVKDFSFLLQDLKVALLHRGLIISGLLQIPSQSPGFRDIAVLFKRFGSNQNASHSTQLKAFC